MKVPMKVVDALGKRCPAPIIEVAQALKDVAPGDSLTLLADDPATRPDIQAWARMTGNEVTVVGPNEFKITRTKAPQTKN